MSTARKFTATKTLSRQSLWSVRAQTHHNTTRTISGTHSFIHSHADTRPQREWLHRHTHTQRAVECVVVQREQYALGRCVRVECGRSLFFPREGK